ncbi:M15 family metallopeptidase [Microbacterium binotii]|uniref:M15 family metallopeptidase n=1 Tax=Microbacterium binotii TaxID=462710 RepID=UPI001F28CDAA|nr:M15 family metallopeptidase [Microbacterium binotii]UIN31556.1 M15 family metallopeptidase [Microbacterium binotii]
MTNSDAAEMQPTRPGPSFTRRDALIMLGTVAAAATTLGGLLDATPAAAANGSWGGYSNGNIPLSALKEVVNGRYLRPDAADAMIALRAAFQSARGHALIVNDGYRSLANQWDAWNAYQAGGNLAAYPGTSNHGWGLAVDLGGQVYSGPNTGDHAWLRSNAGQYGWWWAGAHFSQIEPWHWEYNGSTDPTLEDDLTPEQDNRLKNIENLLAVPGQGYGWPQVGANRIADVQSRMQVPNQGYDFLPAIINQLQAMTDQIAAIQAKVNSL